MLNSIDALGANQSAAVRARLLTQLLDDWPAAHSRVRAMRQEAMKELQDDGLSLRAISKETGISFGRVREIIQGVTKRPPPKKDRPKGSASRDASEQEADDGTAG